jgi:magnesium transporter
MHPGGALGSGSGRVATVISICSTGAVDRSLTLADIAQYVDKPDRILWIDFPGVPTQAELDLLQQNFGLFPRTLAHLTRSHRGPRAVRYLRCRLVVIYDVALDATSGEVLTYELVHLIGERFLITAHPESSNVIPLATQEIDNNIANFGFSVSALTYAILNALVDRYDAAIAQIQTQVDQLRQRILEQHESEGVDDVYRMTTQLGDMRGVMSPEEDLISSMHSPDSTSESPELTDAFQDVAIDLQSAIGTIDQSSTLVSNLLDTYESLKSDALNTLVKRLTVLSIMLALIALIPSVFGISLNRSPFRNGYQGYLVSYFLMGLIGWIVWIVAKRIGWLK